MQKSDEYMNKALKIINDNRELLGIEDIYMRDKLDELRADKDIKCMIELKPHYNLVDTDSDEIVIDLKANNIDYATHGYNPNKENYKCLFIANGEGIAQDKKIGKINMVDIAPTVSRLLGLTLNDCDGRVITEIFE